MLVEDVDEEPVVLALESGVIDEALDVVSVELHIVLLLDVLVDEPLWKKWKWRNCQWKRYLC